VRGTLLGSCVVLSSLFGCQGILGIEDPQLADPVDDTSGPGPTTTDGTTDDDTTTTADDTDTTGGAADAGVDAPTPMPSFEVAMLPPTVRVPLGGVSELVATVERIDGFDGDIVVTVVGPAGVSSDPVTLTGTDVTARLLVTSDGSGGQEIGDTAPVSVEFEAEDLELVIQRDVPGEVVGAPGTLDGRFAGSGAILDIGRGASDNTPMEAVIELSNGDIVVTGFDIEGLGAQNFVTLRYDTDGERVSSFGNNGIVIRREGSGFGVSRSRAVTEHANDTIVVVGDKTAPNAPDLVLGQYTETGEPSAFFGFFRIDVAGTDEANSVGRAFDDSLIIGGQVTGATNRDSMLLRLNAAGSRISGFADDGQLIFDGGGNDEVVAADFAGPAILAVANTSSMVSEWQVRRVAANNGAPDMAYGTDGVVTFLSGNGSTAVDGDILPDGSVFVAHRCDGGACVTKLLPDGTADNGFGTEGTATVAGLGGLEAMFVDLQGRVLLGGNDDGPYLVRLRASGEVDLTFDSLGDTDGAGGGVAKLNLGIGGGIRDISPGSNGTILICGVAVDESSFRDSGMVARAWN